MRRSCGISFPSEGGIDALLEDACGVAPVKRTINHIKGFGSRGQLSFLHRIGWEDGAVKVVDEMPCLVTP